MQSIHTNKITINSTQILLNDFEIDEPKIINFFSDLKELDKYDNDEIRDKFIQLLNFGLMVNQSVNIGEKVDYVKEGFNSLKTDIESQIEYHFSESVKKKIDSFLGEEGTFTKELRDTFGTDGIHSQKIDDLLSSHKEQITSLLDLNHPDSPFKKLEESIESKFLSMMSEVNQQQGKKEAEKKSTQKGAQFEDFVFPILSDCAQFFNCNFEKTGAIKGVSGDKNSKKGDFVMTEKITNKKIVIEAKNLSKDPTTKQILEYSRIAIENRQADYCVFIYCDSDDSTIPEAGMFNEITKNILFITISETDDFLAKERMIRLGCSWALQRLKTNDSVDVDLDEKMKKYEGILRNNLGTIKTVKNNSTSITKACSNMITDLEIDLGLKEKKK